MSAVRAAFLVVVCLVPALCAAQDLAPRAYFPAPVSSNALILTYGFSDGELLFDPTLPVTDVTGTIHAPVVSYYHAFDFFGRSANITGALPFAVGDIRGKLSGEERVAHRAGLADAVRAARRQPQGRPGALTGRIRQDQAGALRVGRQREGRGADRPVRPGPS